MTKKNAEEYSTPTPCTATVVSGLQERLRVQSEALNTKSLAMDTLRYQLTVKLEEQKSRLLKLARRVNTLTLVAPLPSNSCRETQRSPSTSQSSSSTILAQDIRFVELWENPDNDIQLQSLVPALIRLCDERERDREKEREWHCA
jgi:hypothetical protein